MHQLSLLVSCSPVEVLVLHSHACMRGTWKIPLANKLLGQKNNLKNLWSKFLEPWQLSGPSIYKHQQKLNCPGGVCISAVGSNIIYDRCTYGPQ